jgi:hypothetical protein
VHDDDDDPWDLGPGCERAAWRAVRSERRQAAIVTGVLVSVAFVVGYLFGVAAPRSGGSLTADFTSSPSDSSRVLDSPRAPTSSAAASPSPPGTRGATRPSDSFTGSEPGERPDLASARRDAPPAGNAVAAAAAPAAADRSHPVPGTGQAPPVSGAGTRIDGGSPAVSAITERSAEIARPIEPPPRPTSAKPPRAADGEPVSGDRGRGTPARVAVHIAVSEWIVAHRMRDLDGLVALYAPTVSVFGSDRDVPRAAVRRNKARALAQTEELSGGRPTVEVTPGGRSATTRVRLRYVTAGRSPESGEVTRELGWVHTPDGWKITSERDVAAFR